MTEQTIVDSDSSQHMKLCWLIVFSLFIDYLEWSMILWLLATEELTLSICFATLNHCLWVIWLSLLNVAWTNGKWFIFLTLSSCWSSLLLRHWNVDKKLKKSAITLIFHSLGFLLKVMFQMFPSLLCASVKLVSCGRLKRVRNSFLRRECPSQLFRQKETFFHSLSWFLYPVKNLAWCSNIYPYTYSLWGSARLWAPHVLLTKLHCDSLPP